MKKITILLLFCTASIVALNAQSKRLKVGDHVPKWVLPNASKVNHSMDTWKDRVLQINYVDPDFSDMNDSFNDKVDAEVENKTIERESFKGFGIVDTKSTMKPNMLIRMVAKKKERKYGTTVLFDYDASIRKSWGLKSDNYSIVIVDKKRICRGIYEGQIPESQHEKIIQLIIKLSEE